MQPNLPNQHTGIGVFRYPSDEFVHIRLGLLKRPRGKPRFGGESPQVRALRQEVGRRARALCGLARPADQDEQFGETAAALGVHGLGVHGVAHEVDRNDKPTVLDEAVNLRHEFVVVHRPGGQRVGGDGLLALIRIRCLRLRRNGKVLERLGGQKQRPGPRQRSDAVLRVGGGNQHFAARLGRGGFLAQRLAGPAHRRVVAHAPTLRIGVEPHDRATPKQRPASLDGLALAPHRHHKHVVRVKLGCALQHRLERGVPAGFGNELLLNRRAEDGVLQTPHDRRDLASILQFLGKVVPQKQVGVAVVIGSHTRLHDHDRGHRVRHCRNCEEQQEGGGAQPHPSHPEQSSAPAGMHPARFWCVWDRPCRP